ncbi:MAG TPA: HD domain-containing protein [Candidatus Paceibacterota bacterium]|nr:HD domain-containing protein [Candidatus Pacearchaeota archaeon]HRZ50771.1 HD domain-containing protein [Candidatus Paceibacterota bacterium]HSA36332.1 HD domain-containing protein [Candidatus Paceibacterota bacterium]
MEKGNRKQKANLVMTAASIAAFAHNDQKRKVDNTPYIFHPMAVAQKLACAGISDEAIIAAALVHDVLEDTDYSEDKLREELGDDAIDIVKTLTADNTLPWPEKKKKYAQNVKNGSAAVKMVALADKITNLENLLEAHKKQGKAVWDRFNAPREQKIRFEEEMLAIFKEALNDPLVADYEILIAKVKALE